MADTVYGDRLIEGGAEETMPVTMLRTTAESPDFMALIEELNSFLAELNGERNDFYSQLNQVGSIPTALVAYSGQDPVGSGAFRWLGDGSVEIKRMYVRPDRRASGIGAAILSELETWAVEMGATKAILETSKRLAAATHLYQKSGYHIIDNYGAYVGVDDSVCMGKVLP